MSTQKGRDPLNTPMRRGYVFLLLVGVRARALHGLVDENPCPSDEPPEAAYDCCHSDKDAAIQVCPSPWECLRQADDKPPNCTDGFVKSADGAGCVRACSVEDYSCMCLPIPGVCYNNSDIPPVGASGDACCQGANITLSGLPHPEFWMQYDDDEPGVGKCTLDIIRCDAAEISDAFCCFSNSEDGTSFPSTFKPCGHGEPVTGGVNYHGAQSMILCDPDSSWDESSEQCYDPQTDTHSLPVDSLCFKAP